MGNAKGKIKDEQVVVSKGGMPTQNQPQKSKGGKKTKVSVKHLYHIREKIGEGSFATVRKCVHRETNDAFALKIINKRNIDPKDLSALQVERHILENMDHTNIVRIHESFESAQRLYMVMDLLEGGELFDRIVAKGTFSEAEAASVVRQVSSALVYIHDRNIVHRDLKPENLLYTSRADDAQIKIIDFGLAKQSDGMMSTPCGTPGYVAPEILTDSPQYSAPVDCWSLGVITYILLCGFPPFYDKDQNYKNLYHQIRRCRYSFPSPYWDNVSPQAKDLIKHLLVKDINKRLTGRQMLEHPWVAGETASAAPLGNAYTDRIKVYQARKKLKRAVTAIMAVCKLVVLLSDEYEDINDVIRQQRPHLQ